MRCQLAVKIRDGGIGDLKSRSQESEVRRKTIKQTFCQFLATDYRLLTTEFFDCEFRITKSELGKAKGALSVVRGRLSVVI